jgi:hypothetical protein
LIKDQATKNIILKGPCRKGLYPLPTSTKKQAFGVVKPSFERWHNRPGHASTPIISKVISKNNLPCLDEPNKESVCDACQKAKSHQLLYPKSHSVSRKPLDLVFSDVGVLHPIRLEGINIMLVSSMTTTNMCGFISLSINLKFFRNSMNFKTLLRDSLIEKLLQCKLIGGGGEYQKLHSFFERIGISHLVSCPHAHQQNGVAE